MITNTQRDLMKNAVGYDERVAYITEFRHAYHAARFRNRYCANVAGPEADDVWALCRMGLMVAGRLTNGGKQFYSHVTEAGMKELGLP